MKHFIGKQYESLKHSSSERDDSIWQSMRKTAFRIYKRENKWENENAEDCVMTILG